MKIIPKSWAKTFINFLLTWITNPIPCFKNPSQDLSHPYRGYNIENAMNVRIKIGPEANNDEICS